MKHLRPLLILITFCIPNALHSQTPEDSWDRLRSIRTGQQIEVVTAKMKSVQGAFIRYSEQAIALRSGQSEVSVPREEVVSIKDKESTRRKRNVLLGLAIGAAGGLAVGAIAGAAYHEDGETGVFVLVATPIGAGIGAAVGAALPAGSATIYRVRRTKSP